MEIFSSSSHLLHLGEYPWEHEYWLFLHPFSWWWSSQDFICHLFLPLLPNLSIYDRSSILLPFPLFISYSLLGMMIHKHFSHSKDEIVPLLFFLHHGDQEWKERKETETRKSTYSGSKAFSQFYSVWVSVSYKYTTHNSISPSLHCKEKLLI